MSSSAALALLLARGDTGADTVAAIAGTLDTGATTALEALAPGDLLSAIQVLATGAAVALNQAYQGLGTAGDPARPRPRQRWFDPQSGPRPSGFPAGLPHWELRAHELNLALGTAGSQLSLGIGTAGSNAVATVGTVLNTVVTSGLGALTAILSDPLKSGQLRRSADGSGARRWRTA